jgi:hypothetical protein
MKNFRAADKSHAGGDEKHDINFQKSFYMVVFYMVVVFKNSLKRRHFQANEEYK